VPAHLLFLVWTLAASIHLSRRAFRATGRRCSRIETAAGS
jgi:hypothetical protein